MAATDRAFDLSQERRVMCDSFGRRILLLTSLVAMSLFALPLVAEEPKADATKDEAGFVSLFDGKSLAGWEGKETAFRVEKGAVVAGSLTEAIPQNEFLCTTKEYGDFELRLEAKLEGKGENAGIQFRSKRVPDHHEVSGYQCDMGRAWDRSVWGALYDESRRNKTLVEPSAEVSAKAARDAGAWNEFVIRCEGPRVQIWLNGVQTVDYEEQDSAIAKTGVIGLQIHGGDPAEASYRNIRIKPLGEAKSGTTKE